MTYPHRLTIVLLIGFCPLLARAADREVVVGPMVAVVEHYTADRMALERKYGVPTSPEEHDRLGRFYEGEQHQLDGIDFDSLDQPGKVDYLLLASKLRFESRKGGHKPNRFAAAKGVISLIVLAYDPLFCPMTPFLPFVRPITAEPRKAPRPGSHTERGTSIAGINVSFAMESKTSENESVLPSAYPTTKRMTIDPADRAK